MLFLLLLIFLKFNVAENRELRFVQAIWRHGDRSPTKLPYPNDIYDESYWPRGWSQLTDLGVEQLEELGSFFNDRYVGKFVNQSYKPDEIYIQSSDSDRALSSAQAFLDGMYELTQCGINGKIRKLPIPIHSTGKAIDDYLLKPTSTDCPEYDKHYKENSSKKLDKIAEEYSDLFKFLTNVTGHSKGITVKQAGKIGNVQKEVTIIDFKK
uniref:Uncharacterized protein n=1 Tax=Panagrolaimus sp. ES5 TaxID=591445 RepID=A0AC34GA05_9BILA